MLCDIFRRRRSARHLDPRNSMGMNVRIVEVDIHLDYGIKKEFELQGHLDQLLFHSLL